MEGNNEPCQFLLAVIEVEGEAAGAAHYLRRPFHRERDVAVTSVNYNLKELLSGTGGQA